MKFFNKKVVGKTFGFSITLICLTVAFWSVVIETSVIASVGWVAATVGWLFYAAVELEKDYVL